MATGPSKLQQCIPRLNRLLFFSCDHWFSGIRTFRHFYYLESNLRQIFVVGRSDILCRFRGCHGGFVGLFRRFVRGFFWGWLLWWFFEIRGYFWLDRSWGYFAATQATFPWCWRFGDRFGWFVQLAARIRFPEWAIARDFTLIISICAGLVHIWSQLGRCYFALVLFLLYFLLLRRYF